jgi:prepilin-type processing-associated H-X9-DG protein
LIELLVVIAIIGVLIGLLMPAVQAARARAMKIKCASNMHNISLGLTMYADTVGYFPYAAELPSMQPTLPPLGQYPVTPPVSGGLLYNFVDKDTHVFLCPMDITRSQVEFLSYEYFTTRVQGKSMVQITDSRFGTSGTMVLSDFDPIHGPLGSTTSRNYLYCDGHLE